MFSMSDSRWMAYALQLAKKGECTTDPNPRVGCVLVKNNRMIGEGWHEYCGQGHAEVNALKQAQGEVAGATAYVTLEPCCHYGKTPPCSEALMRAGVVRVVVAMLDPNPAVAGKGLAQLKAAGIETASGLMEAQARELNRGFVSRMTRQRPYVCLKTAMTLDGQTALRNGESQWITGPQARQNVHRLRARSSAILTGIGTVLADNPRMTVRLDKAAAFTPPIRIAVDSRLRMPHHAAFLNDEAESWLFTCQPTAANELGLNKRFNVGGDEQGRVDLTAMLTTLAQQGVNNLLVEAGATLNGALLEQGLVDEVVIYMATQLFGEQGRSPWGALNLQTIQQAYRLRLTDVRQVGEDVRFILQAS